MYEIATNFLGVDPIHQPIPVRPTQHYSMGGVRTNKDGAAYGLKGLYAAGEAACWDMHGFNRLGGNSLSETIVAGRVVGAKIVEFLQGHDSLFSRSRHARCGSMVKGRIEALCRGGSENCFTLRNAMQDVMMEHVGIFRNGPDLEEGVEKLQALLERSKNIGLNGSSGSAFSPEISTALRMPGMIKLALCTAYGALMRTESRGAHTREDFQSAMTSSGSTALWRTGKKGDTLPTLSYESVTPWYEIPPGERGYGGGKIIAAEISLSMIKKQGA